METASPSARKETMTVAKRLEILEKLEKGASVNKLASKYGVHKRTIQRYRRNAASIVQLSEHPQMKKKRVLRHEEMDTRLHAWVLERRRTGDVLTDNIMLAKAKELHEEFGGSLNFSASRGWLWRFKKRHAIGLAMAQEEGMGRNESEAGKFLDELSKILTEEGIDARNVYNVAETSLMWKALPHALLHAGAQRPSETKRDRVTVALCANSTGSHKLPPLFVNRYAKPRALKHCLHSLPVVYRSEPSAAITDSLFCDWYVNHFKPSVWEQQMQEHRKGKVLLLIDRRWKHALSQQADPRFELMFLPPDTRCLTQPMDQGVIDTCKTSFRHKLLRRVLQYDHGVVQFYADYDVKDCIDLVSEAWSGITAVDVETSWRKVLARPTPAGTLEDQGLTEINIKTEPEEFVETIPIEEISEWMLECNRTESVGIEEDTLPRCGIEEEEIDHTFRNLAVWAETEPKVIKAHTEFLINFYNKKHTMYH